VPRPLGTTGMEGLPLWDTVEAVYFLVAGVSAGVVIGFLFPSIWRAFRRKFRNTKRFATALPMEPIASALEVFDETPENVEAKQALALLPVESQFVHARSLVQGGRCRDAVQVYLQILGDERVSKGETNRAFYELAQTYALLGLSGRAFDVAFELLSRKPKNRQVFEFLLKLIYDSQRHERILDVLPIWRGDADSKFRLQIAHAICEHGESLLRAGRTLEARNVAALATRWSHVSARARLNLWHFTSEEVVTKVDCDLRKRWIAFAADLESLSRVSAEMPISLFAVSKHIYSAMVILGRDSQGERAFSDVADEVWKASGALRSGEKNTRSTIDAAVMCAALCTEVPSFLEDSTPFVRAAACVSPALVRSVLALERGVGKAAFAAVCAGFRVHRCRFCGCETTEFSWCCPRCRQLEALLPARPISFADTSLNL
jgi:lipopolysaccharide biosynthesis regulator YciM